MVTLKNLQYIHLKLLQKKKRKIQKTVEATGDLNSNETDNRITKVSRSSTQNNLEKLADEHDKEIPKERYISPEERQKIINDLRLL